MYMYMIVCTLQRFVLEICRVMASTTVSLTMQDVAASETVQVEISIFILVLVICIHFFAFEPNLHISQKTSLAYKMLRLRH